MIDMHCHLLFDVDDGPKTLEESLQIIGIAVNKGITDMIVTPHAFSPEFNVTKVQICGQIEVLKEAIKEKNCSISLHTGQEVRIHEDLIDNLKTDKILTLANSRYLLLELPSQIVPAYTVNLIQLILAEDIIPIIAHPERNRGIAEKPERLEQLIRHGAYAQVTAGSLSGHFGKGVQKIALELIKANLIHSIGSDVHNLRTRPLLFNEGLEYLERKGLANIVPILLENNERILTDEQFIVLEPETPVLKKWWRLTS